jgi:long-subunit acyl-CoA synthetase (AMP-forming)
VVCSSDLSPKFIKAVENCPSLEFIIQMDGPKPLQPQSSKIQIFTFEEVEQKGNTSWSSPKPVKAEKDDLVTLVYTSGTTGL